MSQEALPVDIVLDFDIGHKPMPIYQQLKEAIIERIESGQWQADQRLPSENEFVQVLNVSRMTVNRALRELTAAGFLVRLQGVGTFVAEPASFTPLLEVHSISDEIEKRGHQHTALVVEIIQVNAAAKTAKLMGIHENDVVFRSKIIHFENAIPVQFEWRYVNAQLAPDYLKQNFTHTTPHDYLSQLAPITSGEHIVEAVMPTEEIQTALKMKAGEPCLLINRRTWNHHVVVTAAELFYPASRYKMYGQF